MNQYPQPAPEVIEQIFQEQVMPRLAAEGITMADVLAVADQQEQTINGLTLPLQRRSDEQPALQLDVRKDTLDFRIGVLGPFVLSRVVVQKIISGENPQAT